MAKTAYFSHELFLEYTMGQMHPESPKRLSAIRERLQQNGMLDQMKIIQAEPADQHQLELAHSIHHIQYLRDVAPHEGNFPIDADTVMTPVTLPAALRAAGAAVQAVDLVFKDKSINTAFCAVRPPGHHAERDLAMGFCFFNNVAVGALHAIDKHGVKKVAILDFDVHNGNGSIDIFKDDPRVLVCSSFEYPLYPDRYYPISRRNIVCTPLDAGSGSREFRRAIERDWLTKVQDFKPELIMVSAGFDAHKSDPLASLRLEAKDYFWVTDLIMDLARVYSEGRVVSCLEGGYNLEALSESVEQHLRALMS